MAWSPADLPAKSGLNPAVAGRVTEPEIQLLKPAIKKSIGTGGQELGNRQGKCGTWEQLGLSRGGLNHRSSTSALCGAFIDYSLCTQIQSYSGIVFY